MRFCLQPGCPVKVVHGYCSTHTRQREQRRGSSNARGYTWQWGKHAKRFLDRHPLCGMRLAGQPPVMSECYAAGIRTPATLVDHVIPHRGDPGLFHDRHNWQALCASCHGRKTQSERNDTR